MNLKELAQSKLILSFGHINPEGMTKLETDDIANKPLTLVDYDFTSDKDGEVFSVVIFKECPNSFYFGGKVLTDLCSAIEADGQAKKELTKDGLAMTLHVEPCKKDSKKTYVKVELV